MESKKLEILEQTKLSLEEVGRQYLEQRRYIEQQLERRRQLKLKGTLNPQYAASSYNCFFAVV